jgi:hypothetical protein
MAVQAELEKAGLHPLTVELGEVEIGSKPSREELKRLDGSLRKLGFELIDDKKSRIIEKVRSCWSMMSCLYRRSRISWGIAVWLICLRSSRR